MTKVLIVEDEPLVAKLYEKALSEYGFKVIIAQGGKEGVEKSIEEKPDMILMDIMMPIMDGIEALEKIKNDPETKDIPVVMLTNLSEVEQSEEALKKGAYDYLVKKDARPMELGKMIEDTLQEISKTSTN
jgi:CheY-like chemotaxis protein